MMKFFVSDLQDNWRVDVTGKNKDQNLRVGSSGQRDLENGSLKVSVGFHVSFTDLKILRGKMG